MENVRVAYVYIVEHEAQGNGGEESGVITSFTRHFLLQYLVVLGDEQPAGPTLADRVAVKQISYPLLLFQVCNIFVGATKAVLEYMLICDRRL